MPGRRQRLRAYCLYRHRLLGEIARVAARTVTAAMRGRYTGTLPLAMRGVAIFSVLLMVLSA